MAKENMSKGGGDQKSENRVSKDLPTRLETRDLIGRPAGRSGVHVTKLEKVIKEKPEVAKAIMRGEECLE